MPKKRENEGNYEVGYGRPPKEHQFRKGGPSPNPKGRPRKKQPDTVEEGMAELIRLNFGQRVTIRLRDGSTKEVESFQAMMLQMQAQAMAGSLRHAKFLMDMARDYGVLVPGRQEERGGGVLVVDRSPPTAEEWQARYGADSPYWQEHERRMAEQEALYLGSPEPKPEQPRQPPPEPLVTKPAPSPKPAPRLPAEICWGGGRPR
jgi:hypothetical protein